MNMAHAYPRRPRQRGMTLVELMVALVLGLFLVGMVSLTYLQSASGARFGAIESQMNEDGAFALGILQTQLQLAGYSALGNDGTPLHTQASLRGCGGGFTKATEKAAFELLACENGTGSDALAIRYQATALNSQPIGGDPLDPSNPPQPGNCSNVAIAPTPLASGVNASIADNRFYIANDDRNGDAPTLYCRGSVGPTAPGNETAIAPNVERLQLRYAITRTPTPNAVAPHQVTAIVDAAGLPDGDWARVAAVELCVVVRSSRPLARDGLSQRELSDYLDCDGTTLNTSATDGRLRRAYRSLVPLPNLRSALPSPFDAGGGVVHNPYAALSTEE